MQGKIILTLILSAMLLTACAPAAQTETEASQNLSTMDIAAEETKTVYLPDSLPELDFQGETFYALTRVKPHFHGEMFIAEATGEVLNDARYEARNVVAERLNVDLQEDYYGLVDYSDNDLPRTMLLSGDPHYDLYNGRSHTIVAYAVEGLAHRLKDVPYMDLEKPWWNPETTRNVSIGKELYYAVGSHNLSAYDGAYMLLFNKGMMADLGISDTYFGGQSIYEVVKEGNWTYDLFDSVVSSVSADLNGDGTMTKDDRYAFLSRGAEILPSFLHGFGIRMIEKDDDNFLVNNMENNEIFFDAFEKIMDTMWSNYVWYSELRQEDSDQDVIAKEMFFAEKGLFCLVGGKTINEYREMEMDFGIIPWPKANEEQENYLTRCSAGEFFTVPITCDNIELDGAVLEAMASQYYRSVHSVYYEQALKSKNSRDVDSAEMLDIIYSNLIFDFGDTVYSGYIRDGKLAYMMHDNDRNLASVLQSNSASWGKNLETMNAGFGKE